MRCLVVINKALRLDDYRVVANAWRGTRSTQVRLNLSWGEAIGGNSVIATGARAVGRRMVAAP